MKDPEPQDDVWITLPLLMQQFADKTYANYQVQLHEAHVRLERGEIKQNKYDALLRNCLFPMVLMHATGQPATPKYVKAHMFRDDTGTLKLKDSGKPIKTNCFLYIFVPEN